MILNVNGVNLTHLGFAGDLIVFTKATSEGISEVVKILKDFHALSDLKFNPNTNEIYMVGVSEYDACLLVGVSSFRLG